MAVKPRPKMSDKNTKQELLESYHNLLAEVENRPVEGDPAMEVTPALDTLSLMRSLSDLKLTMGERLDSIAQDLGQEIAGYRDTVYKLKKQKEELLTRHSLQAKKLGEEYETSKQLIETEQASWQQKLEEEQQQQEALRRREEEEYRYLLGIKRRKEEDAFSEKSEVKVRELTAREQAIKEREDEFQHLQAQIVEMSGQQATLVQQAIDDTKKELENRYSVEIREMNLKSEHERAIAELRITSLEERNKVALTEIESLKKQLSEASRQLKEVAVTVIEGRSVNKTADSSQAPAIPSPRGNESH